MKRIPVEEAVGLPLGHDITEIRAEQGIKRRAFRRGHIVTPGDLERLKDLGKFTVYIETGDGDEVHEDDAAREIAPLVAGAHVIHDAEPSEGKILFRAACPGLFRVDVPRLYRINLLAIPALPTIPSLFPVQANQTVAAFRIVPLTCPRAVVDQVAALLDQPLLEVMPYLLRTASILVTGNEVHEGRITDGFIPRLTETLATYGVRVTHREILPDDRTRIAAEVAACAGRSDLVLVTGGTSVDPDDVTVAALRDAGVRGEIKGMPIQPGNNFTIGHWGKTPVCAVPAATLFHRATALDLLLPRILAGLQITREDVAAMGHGGLALPGTDAAFPNCTFGRGGS